MPIEFHTIEAPVAARAMREGIAGISDRVRGWMRAITDSYNLSCEAGRSLHATFGLGDLAPDLGSEQAAREAEKILLWTKEACEEALKQSGEWEP